MMQDRVIAFAKEQGYDTAEYLREWRGCSVYEPMYAGGGALLGPPLMILVKGEEIRMATTEEAMQQVHDYAATLYR
jgi:hypothetical protein